MKPGKYQRHGQSATSKTAALLIAPVAGTQRFRVLTELYRRRGGDWVALSDEELTRRTGIKPNSLRPRRVELVEMEMVHAVATGNNAEGYEVTLWSITPLGVKAIQNPGMAL